MRVKRTEFNLTYLNYEEHLNAALIQLRSSSWLVESQRTKDFCDCASEKLRAEVFYIVIGAFSSLWLASLFFSQ